MRKISKLVVPLEGVVEHGFGRGSKTLGFATANLNSKSSQSLSVFLASGDCQDGIYIGWVSLPNSPNSFKAAISVGINPTFEDSKVRLLEAHLLDYNGPDFYEVTLRVMLCAFIRTTYKFTSLEELKSEIQLDCDYAREWLHRDPELHSLQHHPFLQVSISS